MNSLKTVICLLCVSASLVHSQTVSKNDQDNELRKAVLLSDLKTLALEIPKLDGPLARALANAEIADAAWTIDRTWALKLLKEAYQLTYLTEDEMRQIGPELPGSAPRPPTAMGRARTEVRRRILSVARRDKNFADQLLNDGLARITKDDRQMMHAQMARMALEGGDNQAAIRSIQDNMAIDPTQIIFVQLVNDLSIKDRAAADKLILECMTNLSTMRLADGKLARARPIATLMWLVFPNSFFSDPAKRIPNPGPEVMKAYVRYVIEALTAMNREEPGSLPSARGILLTTWLPLNQHAPEFKERFMQLEVLSRTPGKDAALPTKNSEELDQELYRNRQTDALSSTEPNEPSIDSMILREDFETARKLISRLPDGERKNQFTEQVNTKEAISLAKKGDLLRAQNLAERLMSVGSILQVYPLIVEGYARNKDQVGATAAVHEAMRQLKNVNAKASTSTAQFGMPSAFAPTASEGDGILSTVGKLAKAVLPIDTLLGAEIVDDLVVRANASQIDTAQGRTGIDSALFKSLASQDEVRARSAAENFKDRLRRIVAFAAIYQWRATELENATRKQAVHR